MKAKFITTNYAVRFIEEPALKIQCLSVLTPAEEKRARFIRRISNSGTIFDLPGMLLERLLLPSREECLKRWRNLESLLDR